MLYVVYIAVLQQRELEKENVKKIIRVNTLILFIEKKSAYK